MFAKLIRHMLRVKLNSVSLSVKYETSALYVTGDKAQETYSVLVPYLDLETRFKNLENLEENLKLRRMNIHVESLKKLWDLYNITETNRNILESKRVEIAGKMKELLQAGVKETDEDIVKYRFQGKIVKEDLKVLMKGLWGLEKQAIIRALALPNDLDDDTPRHDARLMHAFGEKPNCRSVGESNNHGTGRSSSHLIDYCDPSCYYLSGEAAIFELEVQYYFAEELQRNGFVQFSNADFAWSIVLEGCGGKHRDPHSVFILKEDDTTQTNPDRRLHLVGGASLVSFCAFHAKHFVDHNLLPIKFFTLGRKYEPSSCKLDESISGSIYDSWQASAVELFIAAHDDVAAKHEFSVVSEAVISVYEKLGYHFRVVYLPPHLLHVWESLRASFQMYLPSRNSYVEVGNISISNGYVSKRLLMCYKKDKQERHFLSLVSGTVLSVPKLLACMLESSTADGIHFPNLQSTSKLTF